MSVSEANAKLSVMGQKPEHRGWDYSKFATVDDPLHKSDVICFSLCPRKLSFSRHEKAGGKKSGRVFANAIMGTAVHGALERALPWVIAKGKTADVSHVRMAYFDELDRALAKDGVEKKDLIWAKTIKDPEAEHRKKVAELFHFLEVAPQKIGRVLGVEHGFHAVFKNKELEVHVEGMLDILFRTKGEDKLALADWKSGKNRPTDLGNSRGYELGIYAEAVRVGEVGPDKVKYGQYPDEIYLLMVAEFLPAARDSKRMTWSKSEADFFGSTRGAQVEVKKGMRRGPGWYRAERDGSEMPSLMYGISQMVKTVRAGLFFPVYSGNVCGTCRYKEPCFNEGFLDLDKSQIDDLEQMLAKVPVELGGDDEGGESTDDELGDE